MTDMVCNNCERYGIKWTGWRMGNFTHTECPHCGGVNCHRIEVFQEPCENCGEPASDYSLDGEWLCEECASDSDQHHADFDAIEKQQS